MTFPIKIKKIHFLTLFFAIVGGLYVVRLIIPEHTIFYVHGKNLHQLTDYLTKEDVAIPEYDVTPQPLPSSSETQDPILRHSLKVDKIFQETRLNVKVTDAQGRPLKNKLKGVAGYSKVFNDLNDVQLATASRIGIPTIADREEAAKSKDKLVFVGNSPYYDMKDLTHSIPYLVPRAAICLEEIACAFMGSCVAKGLPMHKLVLTSVLRTENDVKKLRRVNVNASENSCHQYGTTFDISYRHFVRVEDPNAPPQREIPATKLKQVLAEVLEDQRNLGTCYVKYEYRRSSCFHITAR